MICRSIVFSLPVGVFGRFGGRTQSGRAKAINALPWPALSIPGMMPSSQPPADRHDDVLLAALFVRRGAAAVAATTLELHSFSPVLALSATNSPVGVPANTRSPAVVSTDAAIG